MSETNRPIAPQPEPEIVLTEQLLNAAESFHDKMCQSAGCSVSGEQRLTHIRIMAIKFDEATRCDGLAAEQWKAKACVSDKDGVLRDAAWWKAEAAKYARLVIDKPHNSGDTSLLVERQAVILALQEADRRAESLQAKLTAQAEQLRLADEMGQRWISGDSPPRGLWILMAKYRDSRTPPPSTQPQTKEE